MIAARVRALVTRALGFGLLWWILAEGDPTTFGYALPAVAVVTLVSLWLEPPARHAPDMTSGGTSRGAGFFSRADGWVRLVAWYGVQAGAGAVDVAGRALRSPPRIDPVAVAVPLRLPAGRPRQLAVAMANLMPGTLVQAQDATQAVLHALAADMPVVDQWRELEERVARATGVPLGSDSTAPSPRPRRRDENWGSSPIPPDDPR